MADDDRIYDGELRRRLLSSVLGGVAFAVVALLVGGDASAAVLGGITFALIGALLAPWLARRRTGGSPDGRGDPDGRDAG